MSGAHPSPFPGAAVFGGHQLSLSSPVSCPESNCRLPIVSHVHNILVSGSRLQVAETQGECGAGPWGMCNDTHLDSHMGTGSKDHKRIDLCY